MFNPRTPRRLRNDLISALYSEISVFNGLLALGVEKNLKRSRAALSRSSALSLTVEHVHQVKLRLRAEKIGYRKKFLREILKEVRVRDNAVRLADKLPMTVRTPLPKEENPRTEEFFTLYQMVEPMGVEPTASRVRF